MTNIHSLRAETAIPYELKVHLESLEPSEERPPVLAKWAREAFKIARKFERTMEETADWVEQYALEKDYSDRQIRRVLKDNGYVAHPELSNRSRRGHMSPSHNYIGTLKNLAQSITELDDQQIETVRSPIRVADQAQPNILDIAARTTDAERAALLHYVQIAIALLQRLETTLKQAEKKVRLEP